MNVADIYTLKYKNIEGDFVAFNRTKTGRNSQDRSQIRLYLTKEAKEIIKKWGNRQITEESYVFSDIKQSMSREQIFTAKRTFNKRLNKHMNYVRLSAKIPFKVSFMHARHSYATLMKNSGVSLAEISENLGHSDIKTTRYYLDSFSEEQKAITANKLSQLLS